MSDLPLYQKKPQYTARVLKTDRVTSDTEEEVRTLVIVIDNPDFNCAVDQCFGVLVKDERHGDHHRLYSVSDLPEKRKKPHHIKFLVKRCNYIDTFTGEEVQGVVSNYICDRKIGDEITITGPYPLPFKIPDDEYANLILIGLGTGIAPFRAFIRHIYKQRKDWKGKIRLFHGGKTGLELLYMNDKDQDLTQYYDKKTYHAFNSLSPRPYWSEPLTMTHEVSEKAEEILDILWQSNTYIYVAGHMKVKENLDTAFSAIIGSKVKWAIRKADLINRTKWAEVIY